MGAVLSSRRRLGIRGGLELVNRGDRSVTGNLYNQPGARRLLALAVLAGLLLLPVLAGCEPPGMGRPDRVILLVSGDSRGYLEPCGCRRDQAGGLPGRATVIRQRNGAPKLVLDVGNLTPGTRPYELMKLRYLLEGMAKIGYDAVNLGSKEVELDLETLKSALKDGRLPFVSANVLEKESRKPLVEPYRIVSRGGLKIGITGVTHAETLDVGPGVEVRPPQEALAEIVPELKRRCDYLIVLAWTDEDGLREIADRFHEVDCILGGDVPQSSSSVQQINRASVFSVTDKGKVLGEIDLKREGNAYQVESAQGHKIIGDRIPPDGDMIALISRYKEELRTRRYELASAEGMERIPAQESTADEFVGDGRCRSCHSQAHAVLLASKHYHAYETLVAKKSEYDPECLSCHTVGYGLHSGFVDFAKTTHLANVQCESCHGRGKEHAAQMTAAAGKPALLQAAHRSTLKPVTPASCVRCHDAENSENFRYASFWLRIAH